MKISNIQGLLQPARVSPAASPAAAAPAAQNRDKVSISPAGKKKSARLQNLMKQRENLLTRQEELRRKAKDKDVDPEIIQRSLQACQEQIRAVEQQIAQEMRQQFKPEVQEEKKQEKTEPKTKEEVQQERIEQLTNLSASVSRAQSLTCEKLQKQRMRNPSVNNMSFPYPIFNTIQTRLYFWNHSTTNRAIAVEILGLSNIQGFYNLAIFIQYTFGVG